MSGGMLGVNWSALATVAVCVGAVVAGFVWFVMRFPRARRWAFGTAVACVGAMIASFMWFVMPFSPVGEPLDVASLQTPEGSEVVILQVFTGTLEPYVVSLFVRYAGEDSWNQYVIDPDGLYWRAKLSLRKDNSEVVITYGGSEFALLDLSARTLRWRDGRLFGDPDTVKGNPRTGNWVRLTR